MISELAPDGPGRRRSLQAGDVVVSFDSVPVTGVDDLHRALTQERAGVSVPLRGAAPDRTADGPGYPAGDLNARRRPANTATVRAVTRITADPGSGTGWVNASTPFAWLRAKASSFW